MAEIQVYKTKITNACVLLRSYEPEFTNINSAKQFHHDCAKEAIETIDGRQGHKKREKIWLDVNKHLETESNILDSVIQRLNKMDFRNEGLLQQIALITSPQPNHSVANSHSSCQGWSNAAMTPQERNVRVMRPLLEVPTFAGNYMELNTFWSVFESLIHSDDDLSDQEKFLFLKKALKDK
ncbi:hypothetical protein OSTOST_25864 [Ostertagia ostertagi]